MNTKYLKLRAPSLTKKSGGKTLLLLVSDTFIVGIAFRIEYWMRFELSLGIFREDAIISLRYYQNFILVLLPLWILMFGFHGLYSKKTVLDGIQEYDNVFHSSSFGMDYALVF